MGDKTHTTYFMELVRRLKELEIDSGNNEDSKLPLSINDNGIEDEFSFLELPHLPEMFDKMTPEEKETILIWINRNNIPHA